MAENSSRGEVITIDRGDGQLQLELMGSGPLILCLHGWSLDRRMWYPQARPLSASFRLALLDRRGFGASTAPPGLTREPADILAILDHLGEQDCILMGMSQGGRVALRAAYQFPHAVRALILAGAPLDGFQPGPAGDEKIPVALYRSLAAAGRLDEVKKHWLSHPMMQPDHPLVQDMLRDYAGHDLLAEPEPPAQPLAGELDKLAMSSLIITGEYETAWLRLVADALAYGLPRASRATVKGAGHLANLTHTDSFNATVMDFVPAP